MELGIWNKKQAAKTVRQMALAVVVVAVFSVLYYNAKRGDIPRSESLSSQSFKILESNITVHPAAETIIIQPSE